MKFIDDVFRLYREQLTESPDGPLEVVLQLFSDHTRRDLDQFVAALSDDEMFQMVSLFVVEKLRKKLSDEGLYPSEERMYPLDRNIH